MYTLECNKLCKRYDKVRNVIDNLDLQIPEGKLSVCWDLTDAENPR